MNTFVFVALAASALPTREKPLDPNDVKPGYVALLIVILMCVATFFLLRNFLKHTRKASEPWEGEEGGPNKP